MSVRLSRVGMVVTARHWRLTDGSVVSVWKASRVGRVRLTSMNVRSLATFVSTAALASTPSEATGDYETFQSFQLLSVITYIFFLLSAAPGF